MWFEQVLWTSDWNLSKTDYFPNTKSSLISSTYYLYLTYFVKMYLTHRCTIVGNGGGGSLGVLANSLKGVLGVTRKSRRIPYFHIYIFMTKFLNLTFSPPVCIYDNTHFYFFSFSSKSSFSLRCKWGID